MTDEVERLRGFLAQLADEARLREGNAHPSPEELIAYSASELQPAAAEAMRDHLSVCRPCARIVLSIPAFLETPPQEGESEDFSPEADAGWAALRAQLPAQPAAPLGLAVPPAPPDPPALVALPAQSLRDRAAQPTQFALAAGLAACLIGSLLWIATHGRSLAPPPILTMNPPESERGGTAAHRQAAPIPVLRLDAEAAALVLYLAGPHQFPRYRVDILPTGEGKPRSPAAVAAISPQAVLVLLTHRQLPPGEYRLHLVGIDSGQTQPVGDYPLRVVDR